MVVIQLCQHSDSWRDWMHHTLVNTSMLPTAEVEA